MQRGFGESSWHGGELHGDGAHWSIDLGALRHFEQLHAAAPGGYLYFASSPCNANATGDRIDMDRARYRANIDVATASRCLKVAETVAHVDVACAVFNEQRVGRANVHLTSTVVDFSLPGDVVDVHAATAVLDDGL